jgi:hypothetical protein
MKRIDAGGTRLRLRALVAMGGSATLLAQALGVHERIVQRIISGLVVTVDPGLAVSVRELFDAIWDKVPATTTKGEKAAASAARNRAKAANWCAPLGLSDDELDEPGYVPTEPYRPARGVGVANDLPVLGPKRRSA